YAVCSCEPEENEQVIEAFLQKRKDYQLDTNMNKIGVSNSKLKTSGHFFKTYPDDHHMDGFFAARLKRVVKKL
ncbi:MAG: 16S rRNA (cytosine(967)-C(5))-methyltransferase RsmB, partial [Desulfobacteraceae bacterium]|nr:16S rRNA (cytosine(967)-C(5))-methyltransferase RsmB [Desulfobacteraceae bacterium]